MTFDWSKPISYDLVRTSRRVSVRQDLAHLVPQKPGVYAVLDVGKAELAEAILGIGECGIRPNSVPHGLRGRLASNVAHSAAEKIADDLRTGALSGPLTVVWIETVSKESAKELQDALVTLFRSECGRQPRYNRRLEQHSNPDSFKAPYIQLKQLIAAGPAGRTSTDGPVVGSQTGDRLPLSNSPRMPTTPSDNSSGGPGRQAGPAQFLNPKIDIHNLYGHLARFCEALWTGASKAPPPTDLASLISALQRQKLVPSIEAGMMHTIRTVRNSHVHEHRRLGPRETQIVNAAWDVITSWASGHYQALWTRTADLP